MSNDAFPNAEPLFRDAFSLPDPAPELLKLIKEHPTYAVVVDLLKQYTAFVHEKPSRANALALALAAVSNSPDAPLIQGDALIDLFSCELADLHSFGFNSVYIDPQNYNKGFAPTTVHLLTSLLSGLSIRYNLTNSSDQYGNLWESLDADSSTSEVQVIGACIQLLIGGSRVVRRSEYYIQSANEVAPKLNAQKSKGIVKDPNALKFLELAISHAEAGYKRKNNLSKDELDNIWNLLFPSQT